MVNKKTTTFLVVFFFSMSFTYVIYSLATILEAVASCELLFFCSIDLIYFRSYWRLIFTYYQTYWFREIPNKKNAYWGSFCFAYLHIVMT